MADDRLARYDDEWLWHEQTDDQLAGYGHHMSQLLYRLPKDGQTGDMQASIEQMIADLRAAHATLAAVEAVAGEWERQFEVACQDLSAGVVHGALYGAASRLRGALAGQPYPPVVHGQAVPDE